MDSGFERKSRIDDVVVLFDLKGERSWIWNQNMKWFQIVGFYLYSFQNREHNVKNKASGFNAITVTIIGN